MTRSAHSLFRATKKKPEKLPDLPMLMPDHVQKKERRKDDWYPTGQPEAIRALLARDGERIRKLGSVWEPACGDGALVRIIREEGIYCVASDLVDRGCPNSFLADYFTMHVSEAPAIITNPPYNLITARDGKGAWLRHTLEMPNWRYLALLLGWEWPAGKQNGFGALLDTNPFSYCYLMRWKLDFTGEGQAPQRNAWFVWDRDDPRTEPGFRWLDRDDARQGVLL